MIRFREVAKQFGAGRPAVTELSFQIHPGEFVFLTGHSGSGKSTILKLLTREYTLSNGEIEFHDRPLSKLKRGQFHSHRRQIGMIFQDYRLIPEFNIWENIAIPLHIMRKPAAEIAERVTELLTMIQLTDKAHVFPSQLSGGEAQRVAIARSLAGAPRVLLADEPTGNLDAKNALYITELLKKINALGTTVVYATHDLQLINNHPQFRHLILEGGKVVHDSHPERNQTQSVSATNQTPTPEDDVTPESSAPLDEPDDEEFDEEELSIENQPLTTAETPSDPSDAPIKPTADTDTRHAATAPSTSPSAKKTRQASSAVPAEESPTVAILIEEL